MGKAVFCNFPTHGCINPLLATTAELVSRGEKIIYFCTEEFRDKIEKTGAEFRPYKGHVSKIELKNDDFNLFELVKLMLEMTIDKLDHNLADIRNEKPDYIIHDSMCIWGKYISKILNLPAVSLMHSFPITEFSTPFSLDSFAFIMKIIGYAIKGKFDSASVENILKENYNMKLNLIDIFINREELNIVYTSKHMEQKIYKSEKTYRFVGPSLFFKNNSSEFPFEKLRNKKVIYISLGTVHNDNLLFYKKCIEAFNNQDFIVVISVGQAIDINELSYAAKNFIIKTFVPQQQLLAHADIFITHAGMNSVNEALCCGVPMILLPHQIEQKMIAERVCKIGAGVQLNIKKITSERLYQTVSQLLIDPKYKRMAMKYSVIFKNEEKTSHLRAADEILQHIS